MNLTSKYNTMLTSHQLLLGFFKEILLLKLVIAELWDLPVDVVKGVLNFLNKQMLEVVVWGFLTAYILLALGFLINGRFEFELSFRNLSEVAAEFCIATGILGLLPGFINNSLNQCIANLNVLFRKMLYLFEDIL